MKTLENYLQETVSDQDLTSLLLVIGKAAQDIQVAVRVGDLGKAGTQNEYGEDQLALDVKSENIMEEALKGSGLVKTMASEEIEGEMSGGGEKFAVVFDPLDGSSLVDVNLAIGTIVGIYEEGHLLGRTGRDQVAALFFVYGPRLTLVLTVKKGTVEFRLNEEGEFILNNENIQVSPAGKMFAPGNLRATAYVDGYMKLTKYWMENEYKLRYSGGMVPDVNQILLKGEGIFTYPGYEKQPEGKLRLLFECNPLALIMEQAGGSASDGKQPILDKIISELAQPTPIYIGGAEEVKIAEQYLA